VIATPGTGERVVLEEPEQALPVRRGFITWLQAFLTPTGSEGPPSASLLNWTSLILLVVLGIGLGIRLWAAKHISPHVDEPASLLPAYMITERGWPQLPSGAPYLQGATLSYILAPLIKFNHVTIDHFRPLRLVTVAFGTGVIYFSFRLGVAMTRRVWIGLCVAALIAIDPISVEWSAHVRMYAPLEMLAVVLTLLFYQAIIKEPSRKLLAGIGIVFWLAIFTHIAIALFLPPMALIALYVYRDRLWKDRKDVVICGILCGIAPITLTVLNGVLGSHRGASTSGGDFSFVGDHLVDLHRIFTPSLSAWTQLFAKGNLSGVMPFFFFLANGLLIGGYYLWRQSGRQESNERLGVTTLLLLNWLSVGIVAAFTIEPQGRYLIHVQPLGFLIFIMGAREFIKAAKGFPLRTLRGGALRFAAVGLVLLQFINVRSGMDYLFNHPVVDNDYVSAAVYVEARRKPGEPVISALAQITYVTFRSTDNIYWLAGQTGNDRSTRYIYHWPDGTDRDFWLGVPAISGSANLCSVLYQSPGAWILIDATRLNTSWGFRGNMATIITGAADVKFTGPMSTYAMKVKYEADWSNAATRLCNVALGVAPPPDPKTTGSSTS
jgi:hypothetical protein